MCGHKTRVFYDGVQVHNKFAESVILFNNNKFERALKCINDHIEANPHDTYAYIMKSDTLEHLDLWEDAARCLDHIWNPKTVTPDLMLKRGIQYGTIGEAERAFEMIDKAEESGAPKADVCYSRGIVMHKLTLMGYYNMVDGAAEQMLMSCELDDGNISSQSAAANILLSKYFRDHDQDRRILVKVINHAKKSLRLGDESYLTYYNLARAHHYLGKNKTAIKYCDETIKRNPDFVDGYAMKGAAMIDQDDKSPEHYKKAIKILDSALAKDPTIGFALKSKVAAAMILDDVALMMDTLEEASRQMPNDADVWTMLGSMHMAMGDRKNAAKCIDKAREIDPTVSRLEDAQKRMRDAGFKLDT